MKSELLFKAEFHKAFMTDFDRLKRRSFKGFVLLHQVELHARGGLFLENAFEVYGARAHGCEFSVLVHVFDVPGFEASRILVEIGDRVSTSFGHPVEVHLKIHVFRIAIFDHVLNGHDPLFVFLVFEIVHLSPIWRAPSRVSGGFPVALLYLPVSRVFTISLADITELTTRICCYQLFLWRPLGLAPCTLPYIISRGHFPFSIFSIWPNQRVWLSSILSTMSCFHSTSSLTRILVTLWSQWMFNILLKQDISNVLNLSFSTTFLYFPIKHEFVTLFVLLNVRKHLVTLYDVESPSQGNYWLLIIVKPYNVTGNISHMANPQKTPRKLNKTVWCCIYCINNKDSIYYHNSPL